MLQPSAHSESTSNGRRSEGETVIFDGNCRFCRRQIERLARWDRRQRLTFLSLHDPEVRERYPALSHSELMKHIHLIDARGTIRVGAAAFAYLSCKLPRLWPLAPLMHIPRSLPFWQWVYSQLAKRRYTLNRNDCQDGSCDVHH